MGPQDVLLELGQLVVPDPIAYVVAKTGVNAVDRLAAVQNPLEALLPLPNSLLVLRRKAHLRIIAGDRYKLLNGDGRTGQGDLPDLVGPLGK